MLEEMGVRVFDPNSHPGRVDGTPPNAPRQAGGAADLRPAGSAMPNRRPGSPDVQVAPVRQARPGGVEEMAWDSLAQTVAACRACKLCDGRRNTVFGVGPQRADWMVIGEAPGENEDLQGEPFVGQAGKLLDNMLAALGLNRRQHVYIANVLKCRPPGNRNPEPDEVAQCEPFLRRQVALVQPRVILAMGRFAVQTLLQTTEPIGKLRGRTHVYNGVPVIVTYHPAYLLRNLPDKAKAWADLCMAQALLRAEA
ncbi:uracil-DNA glycosylase [Caenimonas sedimenti]|uniref:Type-4 uracil-DNA glycosylase n=2 Tax=Caenimonas sedimenti TaxID=2596921 RepID=A0A562ZNH7_9BURK|nr:uracil-DNA glycosylase [Caenimonas sedimenti]